MPTNNRPQDDLPVETGLGALLSSEPAVESPAPVTLDDLKQAAAEEAAQRASIKAAAAAEERRTAELKARPEEEPQHVSEARKLNDQIHQRIMDARTAARKAEEPKPPQPASKHIMDQTKREMEAGRLQSQWHADQRAAAMASKVSPPKMGGHTEMGGSMTEVFRPHDYIPDPVKNQGHVKVTT
jgi:hypothetical protein